jgi:hypothetical protein
MKYHKSYKQTDFNGKYDLVEEIISAIHERFHKTITAYTQEVHFDDNTTLSFDDGQLLRTIEIQSKKGISAEHVNFTLIHIYKGNQGKSRHIGFDADSKYNTLSLIVAASGSQADIDWGKGSYESLSRMLAKVFPPKPLKAEDESKHVDKKQTKHFNIDWKWVIGTVTALVGVVIGYLQLIKR